MAAFQWVRLTAPAGTPDPLARRLADPGVPQRLLGHEYTALDQAVRLGDGLIAIGVSGSSGRIAVETSTGAVVHLPLPSSTERHPVNADLDRFAESIAAVLQRFPFYGDDSDTDDWEASAAELRALLLEIDSTSAGHNGFWETFTEDVAIGDYAPGLLAQR